MKLLAYLYTDPLLEPSPDLTPSGWEMAQVYHDLRLTAPGKPGGTGKSPAAEPRPQWQQLIQDCQTTSVDGVVIRQLEDLGETLQTVSDRLAQLEALQIPVLVLAELDSDAAASQPLTLGTAPAEILHRLQHFQQQQRSRRIRQGHAQNRVKALPPPGKAPYGYRRGKTGYVIDRTTAPVVKDFFEQFLLYGSVRGAVRYLAKRYNKKISASTGQRWLTNPVYRGDLAYQDGNQVRDAHPAIISRDESAQVDRLLRRNQRLPSRSASAPRSLAGLVTCAQCQSAMTIAQVTSRRKRNSNPKSPNQPQEYLYLRPRTCPLQPKCAGLPYSQVLQATIQQICEELPRALSGVELPDISQIKQGISGAIAAKQTILEQLSSLVEQGILDQSTADLRTYTLRTEIAELQNNLSQLPPVDLKATAQTLSIPQFWLDLTEPERRAYLREFIRDIQLIRQNDNWTLKLLFSFIPTISISQE
ncbi:MAG: recombinase family protein [Leptolyngbyaceae cyanobacterium bins.302]|nr:recombinase family protein [Leptolyngbyaceae cyanobacterium bins.302]